MINIKKEGIILSKTTLVFENEGVLNPAIYQEGNTVHIFYRALRKGNYSTVGYCKLDGPLTIVERHKQPLLSPEFEYESHGVEDARIVKIDDLFYLSYTAYDGSNALGCLATSADLKTFHREGIIVAQVTFEEFKNIAECNMPLNPKYERFHVFNNTKNSPEKISYLWDKNVIFFPRKIKNKFYFLHRIRPDIQVASVNSIKELTKEYWADYFFHMDKHIALCPKYEHEISYIGGGCPPIETEAGWLLIYHGVHDSVEGYVYNACAALMDLEDPCLEIARLPYALFKPDYHWELKGEVNNVVFPTGTALFGDTLYIYYGAADKRIACASMSLKELINELLEHKVIHEEVTDVI